MISVSLESINLADIVVESWRQYIETETKRTDITVNIRKVYSEHENIFFGELHVYE